jgi:hypothetical protein
MSSSNLLRQGGGLSSIVAGVLLLVGYILNLGGDTEYSTVLGETLVLIAQVLLVFALVALWAVQAEQSGSLGALGMVLSVVGTTLNSAVILAEIAGASGADVEVVVGEGVSGVISLLGGLAFLTGLILFGAATMRAGIFLGRAGLLLIVGDLVFGAASFSGAVAPIIQGIGALITCAAFMWLGLALLSGRGASAQQPTRAR